VHLKIPLVKSRFDFELQPSSLLLRGQLSVKSRGVSSTAAKVGLLMGEGVDTVEVFLHAAWGLRA
jgi:hypothetical protein